MDSNRLNKYVHTHTHARIDTISKHIFFSRTFINWRLKFSFNFRCEKNVFFLLFHKKRICCCWFIDLRSFFLLDSILFFILYIHCGKPFSSTKLLTFYGVKMEINDDIQIYTSNIIRLFLLHIFWKRSFFLSLFDLIFVETD